MDHITDGRQPPGDHFNTLGSPQKKASADDNREVRSAPHFGILANSPLPRAPVVLTTHHRPEHGGYDGILLPGMQSIRPGNAVSEAAMTNTHGPDHEEDHPTPRLSPELQAEYAGRIAELLQFISNMNRELDPAVVLHSDKRRLNYWIKLFCHQRSPEFCDITERAIAQHRSNFEPRHDGCLPMTIAKQDRKNSQGMPAKAKPSATTSSLRSMLVQTSPANQLYWFIRKKAPIIDPMIVLRGDDKALLDGWIEDFCKATTPDASPEAYEKRREAIRNDVETLRTMRETLKAPRTRSYAYHTAAAGDEVLIARLAPPKSGKQASPDSEIWPKKKPSSSTLPSTQSYLRQLSAKLREFAQKQKSPMEPRMPESLQALVTSECDIDSVIKAVGGKTAHKTAFKALLKRLAPDQHGETGEDQSS